ncbi:MAG: putative transporter permease protein [Ilumatobacteraceae bacterium]|nr:putative transporter permease protein [Ilumatobacteraceae bacterium]
MSTQPAELDTEPQSTYRTVRSTLLAVAPVIGVVGALGVWQLWVKVRHIRRFILPAPWDVVDHIASDPSVYVHNGRTTLWEAFLGFAIAFVIAMIIATAMAHSRFIERAVMPLAVLIQVTPIIAYAPAAVIWLNFGMKPILFVTSLVCFVPFLLNGVSGLRSVDPNLVELAHSVDATRREIFVRLRLPSALPYLFAAARIAVGLALIGAVLGEFFGGSTAGLGYALRIAQNRNLVLQLWGCIFTLALLGSLATLLISALERRALRWHSSQRL